MKNLLSLSVRIAEGFLSKEEAVLSLEEVADLAVDAGYDAVCMRASQVGIQTESEACRQARQILDRRKLPVTMITGDFPIVYNNDQGPACLRNITPYLDLAETLGASMIRVAIKKNEDIPATQKAADEANERGLTLVHQCHTLSLFETVDACVQTAEAIDRSNFGIIYEPANLEICQQAYGMPSLRRLAPWLKNVYLQNQVIKPDGAVTLDTWCHGPVSFDLIPVHASGGVHFPTVFEALRELDYQGPITVHQSAQPGQTPVATARDSAQYLRTLMG